MLRFAPQVESPSRSHLRHCAGKTRALLILLALGLMASSAPSETPTLHVFGSEGPAPAFHEAATVFSRQTGVKVEVVDGPVDDWIDRAVKEADLVFSSAEFMMSEYVRNPELEIVRESITPLYSRPSTILVRPGNPKGIRDFPDLLQAGMRLLVVHGSGQTGLWEDMVAGMNDVRALRSFRDNISFCAANSAEAVKAWKEHEEIDAWVTWNIWWWPLRDTSEIVSVSKPFEVTRGCSAALTRRGSDQAAAGEFLAFLSSEAGEKIFQSWGWKSEPPSEGSLGVRKDISVVCEIRSSDLSSGLSKGLLSVQSLLESYKSMGVTAEELHFIALLSGPSARWLLKDEAYIRLEPGQGNPCRGLVEALQADRVALELDRGCLQEHGWREADLLPGVALVEHIHTRIVDLELQGYAYMLF